MLLRILLIKKLSSFLILKKMERIIKDINLKVLCVQHEGLCLYKDLATQIHQHAAGLLSRA